MHLHILGICGTFMGSLALLARDLGHKVTGSDANVYPPMSTQLENAGITLMQGYDRSHLQPHPDWMMQLELNWSLFSMKVVKIISMKSYLFH
jgi:UDP-N-acetylmuramate-alanine ligase